MVDGKLRCGAASNRWLCVQCHTEPPSRQPAHQVPTLLGATCPVCLTRRVMSDHSHIPNDSCPVDSCRSPIWGRRADALSGDGSCSSHCSVGGGAAGDGDEGASGHATSGAPSITSLDCLWRIEPQPFCSRLNPHGPADDIAQQVFRITCNRLLRFAPVDRGQPHRERYLML